MKKSEKQIKVKPSTKKAPKPVKKTEAKGAKAGVKKPGRSTRVDEAAVLYGQTPASTHEPIRFLDLFCGIGGFHLAFEEQGGKCVFASDWDKFSQITYEANFGIKPIGDITEVDVADIPEHDVLCAGFPCQPFSLAGVSKKNSLGRKHGFEDERQGNLFFNLAAIIDHHRPPAFVLENVKNLKSHDKGNTFKVIMDILQNKLGYHVYTRVINAKSWVPQHRERIFIVGFRELRHFEWPELPNTETRLGDILDSKVPEKYTLTDHLWQYLQNYAAKHKAAGNGFGFGLVGANDVARTLSARYHKDGSEILIRQRNGKNPRRLTPRECARLMGYPESFDISKVSDTQAYRQFGNSVAVPVVKAIAASVKRALEHPVVDRPVLQMELAEPRSAADLAEVGMRAKSARTTDLQV